MTPPLEPLINLPEDQRTHMGRGSITGACNSRLRRTGSVL